MKQLYEIKSVHLQAKPVEMADIKIQNLQDKIRTKHKVVKPKKAARRVVKIGSSENTREIIEMDT